MVTNSRIKSPGYGWSSRARGVLHLLLKCTFKSIILCIIISVIWILGRIFDR